MSFEKLIHVPAMKTEHDQLSPFVHTQLLLGFKHRTVHSNTAKG